MTDVNNNPILSKPWSVGLFSIDYSPILKLTQPDLVLRYPKADSDKQETQKLSSALIETDRANAEDFRNRIGLVSRLSCLQITRKFVCTARTDCLRLVTLLLKSQKGEQDLLF